MTYRLVVVAAVLTAIQFSAYAQPQAIRWENSELLQSVPSKEYEARGKEAFAYCQREAQLAVPPIHPQACMRAMSSPSPLLWDVCQTSGVDCTESMSSGSTLMGDQCLAYAREVSARRRLTAERAGIACMLQLGWRQVPAR